MAVTAISTKSHEAGPSAQEYPGPSVGIIQLANVLTNKLKEWDEKAQLLSDSEIDNLDRCLHIATSLVRGRRNAIQPINRLAPELLATIFDHVHPHLPAFLPCASSSPVIHDQLLRGYFSLLHVCRHWRSVMATFPHLWSTIDDNMIPLTCLRRSGVSPLSVYFGLRAHSQTIPRSLFESVMAHTFRFHHLHVFVDACDGDSSVYGLMKDPAPNLTSLSIFTYGDNATGVLPAIFDGKMPKLKTLCLRYFTSWPETYFTGLTSLCLHDQHDFSRPSLQNFLDFLESCPMLEELALVRAGPTNNASADPSSVPSSRFVLLKHLKQVDFGDWPGVLPISRLLAHLSLPATTKMFIWGMRIVSPSEDLGLLFPGSSPDPSPSQLAPLSDIREFDLIRINLSTLTIPCHAFISVSDGKLRMCGPWSASQIAPIASRYPLREVRKFIIVETFDSPMMLTTDIWKDIFQHLPSLRTLIVQASMAPGLTRYILSALFPPSDKDQPINCRLLKKIYLEDDRSMAHLNIASCLEERSSHGLKLSKLEIRFLRDSPMVYRSPPPSPSPVFHMPPLPPIAGMAPALPPPPLPPPIPLPPAFNPGAPIPPPPPPAQNDGEVAGDRGAFVKADIEFFKRHVKEVKILVDSERTKIWKPDFYEFTTAALRWTRPHYRPFPLS